MLFPDYLRVKLNKEDQMVTLSIRTTDNKVEVFRIPRKTFEVMISQYQAQTKND